MLSKRKIIRSVTAAITLSVLLTLNTLIWKYIESGFVGWVIFTILIAFSFAYYVHPWTNE